MSCEIYMERAQFIIGNQNTGKSTQIRFMFHDRRLGKQGEVPKRGNIRTSYSLSNERWLLIRLSSPHEKGHKLDDFLEDTKKAMQRRCRDGARRWNFISPLQPGAANNMPDAADSIDAFIKYFNPERVRAVVLSPDKSGNVIANFSLLDRLNRLDRTEVILTDARMDQKNAKSNGLIYADFFDFT